MKYKNLYKNISDAITSFFNYSPSTIYIDDDANNYHELVLTNVGNNKLIEFVLDDDNHVKGVSLTNKIKYKSSEKLPETTSSSESGLHTNAFGYATIMSHTWENGIGVITFDRNITTVGESAFYGCTTLTDIMIPNSVTSIGQTAFAYCTQLTGITIPNSVTNIGNYAFLTCTSLTKITIPNGVTYIGNSIFAYCTSLSSIIVETSNTVYDTRNNCNAIIETESDTLICGCKNTIIPSGVTTIGYGAFAGCISLTDIIIPSGVTSIGDYAFDDCTSLTGIIIPNSVTSVGVATFQGCTSLPVENNIRYADTYLVKVVDKTKNTYTIKEGTRWIGNSAFVNCDYLLNITIPDTVISIGGHAFYKCNSLVMICLPTNPPSLGNTAAVSDVEGIYVPSESLELYKNATNWIYSASRIHPIE